MDELRAAIVALFETAASIEGRMRDYKDPPSKSQLASLQKSVDELQRCLNRLQTAMDAWSEETENT